MVRNPSSGLILSIEKKRPKHIWLLFEIIWRSKSRITHFLLRRKRLWFTTDSSPHRLTGLAMKENHPDCEGMGITLRQRHPEKLPAFLAAELSLWGEQPAPHSWISPGLHCKVSSWGSSSEPREVQLHSATLPGLYVLQTAWELPGCQTSWDHEGWSN